VSGLDTTRQATPVATADLAERRRRRAEYQRHWNASHPQTEAQRAQAVQRMKRWRAKHADEKRARARELKRKARAALLAAAGLTYEPYRRLPRKPLTLNEVAARLRRERERRRLYEMRPEVRERRRIQAREAVRRKIQGMTPEQLEAHRAIRRESEQRPEAKARKRAYYLANIERFNALARERAKKKRALRDAAGQEHPQLPGLAAGAEGAQKT